MRLALLFVGLAACSAETVAQPPPAPVHWSSLIARAPADAGALKPAGKERAAAESYLKAVASPGFARLGAVVDEDAHFAFQAKDVHGRERVLKAHENLFGAFDQRAFAISRIWITDSSQAVEWTMTGSQAKEWMGVPATQKPVTIKGLTLLWTKDDGTISDVHVYFDEAVVKGQLGVGPLELQKLPPPAVPTGAPQIYEQAGSAQEAASATVMRTVLDALEEKKEPEYVGAMAEDVEIYTLERAEPMRGREATRAYFKTMHKSIGQLDTVPHGTWGAQNFAVAEYSIAGEQLGPLAWIPTFKNRLLRMYIVDVAEIHDGKITRLWRYDNFGALATP